ncbi:MAG: BON domain-containing protein [Bryobacterales bacterium]|nr:BON domain-containing protein [Bryobacterales bacterium]
MLKTIASFFLICASLAAMPNLLEERRISQAIDSLPGYNVLDTINFRVNGSQVILDGDVSSPALKAEALQRVALLPGVLTVINRIAVTPIAAGK